MGHGQKHARADQMEKHASYERVEKPQDEEHNQSIDHMRAPSPELVSIPPTPHGSTPLAASAQHSPLSLHSPANFSPSSAAAPFTTISPSKYVSPAAQQSPLTPLTPRTPLTPSRFLSPIGTPMRKAFINMKQYLEDIGHLTKLNPQDAWLPITESQNGNAFYSAFHNLNAAIGFQALLLPVAFTFLGWTWGVLVLVIAFLWQLYTLHLLICLHEAVPGKRYNRYVELSTAAFGKRLGLWLTVFPVINLSGGTAVGLIIIGGNTLKLFYETACGTRCTDQNDPLTTIEWYLVFAALCCLVAQLPNLNSVAYVSFVGAFMAVTYSTLLWALSLSKPRPQGVSYDIVRPASSTATAFSILNALGVVAFAFRGHNLVLEIQSTMPSTLKHPARVPMWRGTKAAYMLVAFCFFPLAIGGYWAYGNKMLPFGIQATLPKYHKDISPALLGMTFLCIVLSLLSSFQIYSMPVFDFFEQAYTRKTNKPCPKLIRLAFRIFFVFIVFFVGVALPFISSFAGLIGGLTSIPVTFTFPCFMWIFIKKPARYSFSWYINWGLGVAGVFLTFAITAGGIWSIIDSGLKIKFFKPQ